MLYKYEGNLIASGNGTKSCSLAFNFVKRFNTSIFDIEVHIKWEKKLIFRNIIN